MPILLALFETLSSSAFEKEGGNHQFLPEWKNEDEIKK